MDPIRTALQAGLILLCACPAPDEPEVPDHEDVTVTSEQAEESTESTTEDTGDGNWGIVLDVGPPYYSGTESDT